MNIPNHHISMLLQQIRFVENEHNQLVDQYFQIKEHVKQSLINLHTNPTSNHLNIYNNFLNLSESIMKAIRSKRFLLTNLINEMHKNGIYLDDDDDDDHNQTESSLDEGIDEHSFNSKLSSLNNSEHTHEDFFS